MSGERVLLDTAFIEAYLNRRDQHHEVATRLWPHVRSASRVFITEAVTTDRHFIQAGFRALMLEDE